MSINKGDKVFHPVLGICEVMSSSTSSATEDNIVSVMYKHEAITATGNSFKTSREVFESELTKI